MIYLPRLNFSPKNKELPSATIKTVSGLKADTNSGPRFCTHQDIRTTAIPETMIPYIIMMHSCTTQLHNVNIYHACERATVHQIHLIIR